jgi:hypothetical protein
MATYEFDVMDDPSLDNDDSAELSAVASDTGCSLSTRTISGSATNIKRAWNLALMHGWSLSVLRQQ